jgi:hypothetical protein
MLGKPKTLLSFEELTAIAARLNARSQEIHQFSLQELVLDLRVGWTDSRPVGGYPRRNQRDRQQV